MILYNHELIKSTNKLITHTNKDILARSESLGLLFFDCVKCNKLFWLENNNLYYWNNVWVFTELSCEELAIKDIIE